MRGVESQANQLPRLFIDFRPRLQQASLTSKARYLKTEQALQERRRQDRRPRT